jgi:hypothetical protein
MPLAVDSCQERSENKLVTGSVTVHGKGSKDIVEKPMTPLCPHAERLTQTGWTTTNLVIHEVGETLPEASLSFPNTLCFLISKLWVHSYVKPAWLCLNKQRHHWG